MGHWEYFLISMLLPTICPFGTLGRFFDFDVTTHDMSLWDIGKIFLISMLLPTICPFGTLGIFFDFDATTPRYVPLGHWEDFFDFDATTHDMSLWDIGKIFLILRFPMRCSYGTPIFLFPGYLFVNPFHSLIKLFIFC